MITRSALYQNRTQLAVAALILLLLVGFVSVLTSTTIVRPISALIRQTEREAQGERGAITPLSQPGTLELDRLSHAFTRMATTLEQRADYIRTFASHVSHEFKTPLASIRGTVELMRDHFDDMSASERERFLTNLEGDAERLERLVKRLLELARADMLEPEKARCDVPQTVRRAMARFSREGMNIVLEGGEASISAAIGEETLDSILMNLLENARQHAGSETTVQLRVGTVTEPESVWIELEDQGPGISAGNVDRIFEPFFTTARGRGGTGLGLSIVRSLLEAHRGEITLVPSAKGACFRITLPRA